MNKSIEKISGNIKRLLTNEEVVYKTYLYLALTTVLLVGVFGIFPLTKELIGKFQMIKQMTELNSDLSNKFNEVSRSSEEIKMVGEDVLYLNKYLPEDFDLQNYMIDFVTACGKAGYSVDAFIPAEQGQPEVEISISLSGNGDLIQLIKNIENMNRVSEIQSVDMSKKGTTDTLRLTVKTYIMEKQ